MTFQTGSIDKNGLARTEDGKLYVTAVGNAAITSGSGVPILLASSWVAVSGAADTNENTLATITVPANTLRANGILRLMSFWSFTNNANTKTMRVKYSGAAGTAYMSFALTTQGSVMGITTIANANATNSQTGGTMAVGGNNTALSSGATAITSSVDTTAATTILLTGQKATGTDTLTLIGYTCEYIRPVS